MDCPDCNHKFTDKEVVSEAAKINGRRTSEKKAETARKNGEKSKGRPPKQNV